MWREFTETLSRQTYQRRETDKNLDAFKRGLSVDRFVHSTDNCKRCSIVSEFYFLESIQKKSPGKEIKESVWMFTIKKLFKGIARLELGFCQ